MVDGLPLLFVVLLDFRTLETGVLVLESKIRPV
jgi:hypothetical protein